jgi:tripartite-type tricarboxylate transporter receptor subunit TctC
VPGFQALTMVGVYAPAHTPAPVINILNRESARILNRPDAKERLLSAGVEPVGNSPAEFSDMMRSEVARMSKVIKDAGIRAE